MSEGEWPTDLRWSDLFVLARCWGASSARWLSGKRGRLAVWLQKIQRAWPDLHYRTVKGGLVLLPSPPRIPPSHLRLVTTGSEAREP